MSIVADSQTSSTSTAGLSNRLLAIKLFDNSRLQREGRHRWANILELMAGEGDDPAFLNLRHRQLTEIVADVAYLEAEARALSDEIARRRTGGAR